MRQYVVYFLKENRLIAGAQLERVSQAEGCVLYQLLPPCLGPTLATISCTNSCDYVLFQLSPPCLVPTPALSACLVLTLANKSCITSCHHVLYHLLSPCGWCVIQPKLTFAATFQLMHLHSSVRSFASKDVTFTLHYIPCLVPPPVTMSCTTSCHCNGKVQSFSSVASDTWNRLLCHLSSISALPAFRKRLKHHLFSSAFSGISSPSTGFVMSSNPWM